MDNNKGDVKFMQQRGIKIIKGLFNDLNGFEVSIEDKYVTVRVLKNRFHNASHVEEGVVEQNRKLLKEVLEVYYLPFNMIECEDYDSFNIEIQEE